MLLAALSARAAFNDYALVRAGTPEATQVISRQKRARHIDLMNAQGYNGGVNRDAGMFYYEKSLEIDGILEQLHQGRAVSLRAVRSALNNTDAIRYGATF
jgi:hypothetical protein